MKLSLPQISFGFGQKNRPLIGLDITTSSIKLIELARSGDQYRVEAYAAEATPHSAINEKAIVDAEAVGEAIKRAIKRSGARARKWRSRFPVTLRSRKSSRCRAR